MSVLLLENLSWQRLPFRLVNVHAPLSRNIHAIPVVEAVIQSVTSRISASAGENDLKVFFHIRNRRHSIKVKGSTSLDIESFFIGGNPSLIEEWKRQLVQYLSEPEGGRNFALENAGDIEARSLSKLMQEWTAAKTAGEICLEFLTPVPFRVEKEKKRTLLSKESFLDLFLKRFTRLFGGKASYLSGADDFHILPYYWNYAEIKHWSHSQPGSAQYINGCVGPLYLRGEFKNLLPYLILGTELHAGSQISNAQGYYRLLVQSPGYFARFFPNAGALTSVTRQVLEKYDHAAEQLATESKLPFNESSFADSLAVEINSETYIPSPGKAFSIQKRGQGERIVEQPVFRDLIVQEYLLKTLTEVAERMFENESIGFRRGVSRQKAVDLVRDAVVHGFQYVIESDVEDFFPSVELAGLERLLDFYIPEADRILKELIKKIIHSGFHLNGAYHARSKGLAMGSPLSPLLANLYLDSFDESVKKWDVRLIRYADDFLILTKTRESADQILTNTEALLSDMGLHLKKEKTCIKQIREGFHFLGIQFSGMDSEINPEEHIRLLKKPLYVTEPFLFVAVNGDAVEIRRKDQIIETIPFRRLSEIMMMERSVLSTALIRQCTENNIPVTMTLGSGYYITTIKPDSKKYYDISFQHAKRYAELTDTELLAIAKDIAAHKISNQMFLFRQRYSPEQGVFLKDLGNLVQKINAATDLNEVRGLEGAAARKTFRQLNTIIDVPEFHIHIRERKAPDPINSLLNFGYYLLFSRINATMRASGLNPYLGFLHSPEDNYESLVSDMVELFRARIDRFLVRLINLKVISKQDFVKTDRGYYLTRDAIRRFLMQYETEMEKKGNSERLTLKQNIHVQVQVLKSWAEENRSLQFYTWDA